MTFILSLGLLKKAIIGGFHRYFYHIKTQYKGLIYVDIRDVTEYPKKSHLLERVINISVHLANHIV